MEQMWNTIFGVYCMIFFLQCSALLVSSFKCFDGKNHELIVEQLEYFVTACPDITNKTLSQPCLFQHLESDVF